MKSNTQESRPNSLDNALEMFDAAIETADKEAKIEKTASAEAKKEDLEKDINTLNQSTQNFKQLAENSTYDELQNTAWEPLLRAIAVELNTELPADLEKNLTALQKINKRLKMAESLTEEAKNKPDVLSAITTLRNEAERIMKEWAGILYNQFNQLAEYRKLEYGVTEKAIRDILDSPAFSASAELQDETYPDFKRRTAETLTTGLTEDFRSRARKKTFDIMLRGMYIHVPRDIKDTLKSQKDKYISGKLPSGELTEIIKSQSSDPNSTTDLLKLQEFIKESDEITKTSMEILAEEKIQKIIKIIEEELDSEEERHSALGYIKQYLPKLSIKLQYYTTVYNGNSSNTSDTLHNNGKDISHKQIAIIKNIPPYREGKEKTPSWLLKVLREYNEIMIFKNMAMEDLESLGDNLVTDQILRAKTGEEAFDGQKTTTVKEGIGDDRILLQTEIPATDFNNWRDIGFLPKNITLNPELVVKAETTIELLEKKLSYPCHDTHLQKILGGSSEKSPFDKTTGDLKDYGENEQIKNGWGELIEMQKNAGKPTAKEVIENIIEKNDGVYPVDTAAAGIRMIEALKGTVLEALHHAQSAEEKAKHEIKKSKQQMEDAESASEGLRGKLETTLTQKDATAESLEKERGEVEKLTEENTELKMEVNQKTRELDNIRQKKEAEAEKHKQNAQALLTDITNNLAEIEKIRGFGSDKKKSAAFMKLLNKTQEKLEELTA